MMPFDHIVLDCEIQKTVNGPPDNLTWDDTDKMGVACCVVYEFQSDRFRIYGPQDLSALKQRIERADRVTGFNSWRFDLPLIWGLKGRADTLVNLNHLKNKSDDILRRIWISLGLNPNIFSDNHKGWGLDNVVRGTLHATTGKIGHGADAPKWFQNGEWSRVVNYCVDDVALTRDLCVFIDRHGYVCNADRKLFVARWAAPVTTASVQNSLWEKGLELR